MRQDESTSRIRPVRLLLALLAFVLLAAACSSDDDAAPDGTAADGTASDGTSADDTTGTSEAPPVDASAALGEPNPASGEPVVVGLISASDADNSLAAQFTRVEDGMNAAVEYANEYRAGAAGRPIELFVCQGGETPAGSQDCANQMVNRGAVAVVMPFTGQGAAIVPVLANAGIPYITLSGASQEELTTPGAFALTGGYPATLAAFAQHAADNGVGKLALVVTDVPGALSAAQALGAIVFGNAGVEFETIPVPLGTADMTPQVQAAADGGADAIAMTGDLTFCSSFLQAYQTLALDQPRYLIATCIDPTVLDAFGNLIEGSIMTGLTSPDTTTEDAEVYAGIAETYGDFDPDPTVSTGQAGGVVPLLTFVNLMDSYQGEVTATGILDHIRTAVDVPIFLGAGASFTCDGTAISLLANVCSADTFIGTVDAEGTITDPELIDVGPLFATG
jgi:branched-chain amino acid transport system substrate-binding protein